MFENGIVINWHCFSFLFLFGIAAHLQPFRVAHPMSWGREEHISQTTKHSYIHSDDILGRALNAFLFLF